MACLDPRTRFFFPFLLLVILLPVTGYSSETGLDGVVLVVSDGTSMELLTAARDYAKGADGHLALDGFSRSAFVHTYSASDYVTDSSAAATAMARGIKAPNRVVGLADAHAETGPASILDRAKKAGWSTAVITDDDVTGGTPSPFLVEHGDRGDEPIIAAKLVERLGSRVDIVLGGGAKYFFDRVEDPRVVYEPGQREIIRKTQARLAALPVATFDSWAAFCVHPPKDERPILGVFYPGQFPFFLDGTRTPRLRDMVEKTVAILRERKRPFFLMVEAELPDVACHRNQARRAMSEVLEFDAAIEWLRKNLGPRTLLLATTDHNNGGFTINGPPMPRLLHGNDLLGTDALTGGSYLTWASGPGADRKAAAVRAKILTEPGKPRRSVEESIAFTDPDYAQPALIEAKAAMHSGGDVWLLADGPGSESVRGFLDNTDIFRIMADAVAKASADAGSRSPPRNDATSGKVW